MQFFQQQLQGSFPFLGPRGSPRQRIVMEWSTGAVENYEVINDGRQMMFKLGGGRNKLWDRVR